VRRGYVPVSTASYGPADTLHVLIGRGAGGERAFFFNEGRFIGTDASEPSAHIGVLAHGDSEVTLAYDVFAANASAPSGQRRVRFALDMGALAVLDPLPSAARRR
jgi:LppP/LprE lipoprotein